MRSHESKAVLLEGLRRGWNQRSALPRDFVECWNEIFGTVSEISELGENSLEFRTALPSIRLRGTQDLRCSVIGGTAGDSGSAIPRITEDGSLHLVMCCSAEAERIVNNLKRSIGEVRIAPVDLENIIATEAALDRMRRLLRDQVPIHRLIPYSIMQPAYGNMFFGRTDELHRLQSDVDTSYAIAGPSRTGKTSLVKRYFATDRGRSLQRPSFYVDLFAQNAEPDGLARSIAMKIEGSSIASRVTAQGLATFLTTLTRKIGGPIELVIDEVDELCQMPPALNALASAARSGACRLVLCGRAQLLKVALSEPSPLGMRMHLMRLEPLSEQDATDLIKGPIEDLGFRIADPAQVFDRILHLTGRLPHHIQFYARGLIDLAIDRRSALIGSQMLDTLMLKFETAQYCVAPLLAVQSSDAQFVARRLLRQPDQPITPALVQRLASDAGRNLSLDRSVELCNELLIHNVLSWSNGAYRVATEALRIFATRLGLLEDEPEAHDAPLSEQH